MRTKRKQVLSCGGLPPARNENAVPLDDAVLRIMQVGAPRQDLAHSGFQSKNSSLSSSYSSAGLAGLWTSAVAGDRSFSQRLVLGLLVMQHGIEPTLIDILSAVRALVEMLALVFRLAIYRPASDVA